VTDPANGARIALLADGQWREMGEGFDRALLLFGEATRGAARAVWTMLGQREGWSATSTNMSRALGGARLVSV
jgi:DNA polymerase-3 subunit chi